MTHLFQPALVRTRTRLAIACGVALLLVSVMTPAPAHGQKHAEVRNDGELTSSAAIDYSYANFGGDIAPWHLSSVSVGHRNSIGSIIGRVNYAHRFGADGLQVEADAYPHLSSSMYAYVNLGYSGASIFPGWRSGAELFTSLPRAWEASAGYRQLRFNGTPVTLITGSVGRYVGNYWFSLRPFIHPTGTGTSASASLTARRYFEDGDNFVGARIGFGGAPSDQIAPDQATRTSSFATGVQGSRGLSTSTIGTWSLSYDRDELAPGRFRKGTTGAAGVRWLF